MKDHCASSFSYALETCVPFCRYIELSNFSFLYDGVASCHLWGGGCVVYMSMYFYACLYSLRNLKKVLGIITIMSDRGLCFYCIKGVGKGVQE